MLKIVTLPDHVTHSSQQLRIGTHHTFSDDRPKWRGLKPPPRFMTEQINV